MRSSQTTKIFPRKGHLRPRDLHTESPSSSTLVVTQVSQLLEKQVWTHSSATVWRSALDNASKWEEIGWGGVSDTRGGDSKAQVIELTTNGN